MRLNKLIISNNVTQKLSVYQQNCRFFFIFEWYPPPPFKSRKGVTVVVKEVVINIYVFFGWMGTFVVFFKINIGTVYVLLSISYFFKDVVNTKCTILYYYRYFIIMSQTSTILKLINE